jgi:hypothetical protein
LPQTDLSNDVTYNCVKIHKHPVLEKQISNTKHRTKHKTFDIEKYVSNRLFAQDGVRPKCDMYKDLQECNREKEWDYLEEIVYNNSSNQETEIIKSNLQLALLSI